MGEIGTEAGAEVDMPAPESADGRFGIFVVVSPETAGLTRVFLFSHSSYHWWSDLEEFHDFIQISAGGSGGFIGAVSNGNDCHDGL